MMQKRSFCNSPIKKRRCAKRLSGLGKDHDVKVILTRWKRELRKNQRSLLF
jgi:hypothetical protein